MSGLASEYMEFISSQSPLPFFEPGVQFFTGAVLASSQELREGKRRPFVKPTRLLTPPENSLGSARRGDTPFPPHPPSAFIREANALAGPSCLGQFSLTEEI